MAATLSTPRTRQLASGRARRALCSLEASTEESALVGIAEAADYLGVAKPKIWSLIEQERMPAPVANLICGQVWIREELRELKDALAAARARRSNGRR